VSGPWHLQNMNAEEEHWWKNLQALHQVNVAWNFDRSQTLFQALKLENLLMHRSLNTRLNQLEREIWILQSEIACQSLEEKYPIYREGAVFFKKRWKHLNTQRILKLQDIREMLFALYDSPFAGYPHQEGFFIQRATQKKVHLHRRICPHQNPSLKNQDLLCTLHGNWMLGFMQAMNPIIKLYQTYKKPYCEQIWSLEE